MCKMCSMVIKFRELAWWRHDMETCSALLVLVLCVGNPSVTGEFPSQRASNAELWCFRSCEPEHPAEQKVRLLLNWNTVMLIMMICFVIVIRHASYYVCARLKPISCLMIIDIRKKQQCPIHFFDTKMHFPFNIHQVSTNIKSTLVYVS